MENIGIASVAAITVIAYIIGALVKLWPVGRSVVQDDQVRDLTGRQFVRPFVVLLDDVHLIPPSTAA